MTVDVAALNQQSLSHFKGLFASLDPPPFQALTGVYQAAFVGPGWVRALAGPALKVTGLDGWCGKAFDGQGGGLNIVRRQGRMERLLPMRVIETPSFIDDRPGLALAYPTDAHPPWPWIRDELRRLDEGALLGMVLVWRGPLWRFPFPFLLRQVEGDHEL